MCKTIYVFNPEKNKLEEKIILNKGLDCFTVKYKNGKVEIYGTSEDKIYRVAWQ